MFIEVLAWCQIVLSTLASADPTNPTEPTTRRVCAVGPRLPLENSYGEAKGTVYVRPDEVDLFSSFCVEALGENGQALPLQFSCTQEGPRPVQTFWSTSSLSDSKSCPVRLEGRYVKGDFAFESDLKVDMTAEECRAWVTFRDTVLPRLHDAAGTVAKISANAVRAREVWQTLANETDQLRREGKLMQAVDLSARMAEAGADRLLDLLGLIKVGAAGRIVNGSYLALKCALKGVVADDGNRRAEELASCLGAVATREALDAKITYSTASLVKSLHEAQQSQRNYERVLQQLDRQRTQIIDKLNKLDTEIKDGRFGSRAARHIDLLKDEIDKVCHVPAKSVRSGRDSLH